MIFTILYIGIIVQIVLFIIAVKKKKQKIWMFLFVSQIIAYITSIIMTIYYGLIRCCGECKDYFV